MPFFLKENMIALLFFKKGEILVGALATFLSVV